MNSLVDRNSNSHTKALMLILLSIFNAIALAIELMDVDSNLFREKQINILIYTSSFDPPLVELKKERMRKCMYNNCFVRKNKFIDRELKLFDVLLFGVMQVAFESDLQLPRNRTKHQIYIFVSREPPALYPISNAYNEVFNFTWTYKLDSDIAFRYLIIKNKQGVVIGPKRNMKWIDIKDMKPISKTIVRKLKHKRKAAAWFVSHCKTPSDRISFIKDSLKPELEKYELKVDIFGQCGDGLEPVCPMENEYCHAVIESDYYFYLAFENSICEDYVTEKVLTATKHFAVPVVFGGADYTRFLPPGSYLDALELGPRKLAYVMNETIYNRTKYYEFFKWHRHYSLHDPSESPETDYVCALCTFLNDQRKDNFRKTVYNVSKYFE